MIVIDALSESIDQLGKPRGVKVAPKLTIRATLSVAREQPRTTASQPYTQIPSPIKG
jgi:hypothetical protein